MNSGGHARADAFFLDTPDGQRFCLYHAPAGECRGALVYVHPFAEEMNRSRRMAALGARALAAQGYGVLLLDLHGCGDSAGDFGDASWDGWLRDIAAGRAWIEGRLGRTAGLMGLRVGALLAVAHAQTAAVPPERLLLWQPVTNGSGYLNGFLRLRLAGELLAGGSDSGGTELLREALAAGESLEIAGYLLNPQLAAGLDAADARALGPRCPISWFEVTAGAGRPLPPAAVRVADTWRLQGSRVDVHLVQGPQFWTAPETVDCPALLEATLASLETSDELVKKSSGQGASSKTVREYGETMQRSHGDFFTSSMTERALAFACRGAWLYGILSLPQATADARRGVLIVVGGPQYRAGSHRQFTLLARDLAAAGIPAMRFDYRGMGDSEGDLQSFENVDEDLRAAIDRFFAEVPGMTEVVLWGLCDGASAAALYAPQDARVAGLVLLNPWVRTEEGAARATIKHYYKDRLFDPRLWNKIKKGEFDVKASVGSLLDNVGKAFSSRRTDESGGGSAPLPERMHGALSGFGGRVLVVLSGADLTAQEFADLSSRPGAWQRLLGTPRFTRQRIDKADHTFSRRPWQDQVSGWTRDWLRSW